MANTQVITRAVRLSYLNVFQPRTMGNNPDGAAKYSACLLIPKTDTKTYNAIIAACDAARLGSAAKFNGKVPNTLKLPIHDGDGEMPNGGEYGAECKGMWVLNASSATKPGLVNRANQLITDETELYSGCWAYVDINFYAYNANGNRGIACGLNNLQKVRDDEALGGRQRVQDVFKPIEDDEDDLGL